MTTVLINFAGLFDGIPDAYAHLDENGCYATANSAFERHAGRTRAQLAGRKVEDVTPHLRLQRIACPGGTLVRPQADSPPARAPSWLARLLHRIPSRATAAQEIVRYAAAIEQAAETIVITDLTGTILYANPAFERTTGYAVAEAIGKNPRILKSGKQDEAFYRGMWETLARGEVWRGHFQNRRKDGAVYQEEATISPVRDASGRVVNYIALKLDVTREIELQARLAQAQKMESIGRLAGGIAHDFNNLLTVINGNADLALAELQTGDSLRELVEEILKAGERGAGLIRQLLTFSRKQVLQTRALDLNRVVEGMRGMLQRLVGEDVELRFHLSQRPPVVRADPHQFEQVILNLAINARDAMPEGGAILIETGFLPSGLSAPPALEAGTECVVLTVSDSGTGMDEATCRRIFEPFFTTKESGKGTGLGLATVQGIVTQSGGRIDVESEPGLGTAFRVYLPALHEAAAEESPAIAAPRGAGQTILVVEDQPEVRRFTLSALRGRGYRILEAADPREAIELFAGKSGSIDLVLTDIRMPHMNGRELALRLESIRPGIKILYMSGYADGVGTSLLEGPQIIQKPFSAEALAESIGQALSAAPHCSARVLVADDEPGVRTFLRSALERAGYRVSLAEDGQQALFQIRAGEFELLIIDLVMPSMEGIETIRELRRESPRLGIIAVSGGFNGQFLSVAQIVGADAAIAKPIKTEHLLCTVAEVLGKRR